MPDKSIIIIGAGVAGLSAGCYGQMNGYHTRIFEMDTRPGGLCTAWKRKGYTVTTIHWFMGAGPKSSYYKIWEELGAAQGMEIVYYDKFLKMPERAARLYKNRVKPENSPARCSQCGQCEEKCTQHLHVSEEIKYLLDRFGKE